MHPPIRFLSTIALTFAFGCGSDSAVSDGDSAAGGTATGTGGNGAGGSTASSGGAAASTGAGGLSTGTGGGPPLPGAGGSLTGGSGGADPGGAGGVEGATGGASTSGGAAGTDAGAGGEPGEYDYWPNPDAPANSSAWLREHHDAIRVMHPRVLVLDVQRVGQPIETVTERIIDAVAEGSRYHGYSDADAPAFLEYEIEKIVDLRDPTAEYPSFWPPGPNFDVGELYTEEFAARFGFEDPDDPGTYLTLCDLFERGVIHELWIAAEAGVRAVYENQSRMQRYDDDLQPIPGNFQTCTNGCYNDPERRVNCSVTARMQEVNKGRGPGCFIHAAGHALENMHDANPYWRTNANRFFYIGMRDRYDLPYDRLYDIDCFLGQAPGDRRCSFPSPTTLQYDAPGGQQSMTFDDFGQGCGDIHHKPNIYGSGVVAAHACEHYGLGDGPGGQDQTTLYSQAGSLADTKMAEYEAAFPDCDGGWNTYLRQSMPGYGNRARAEDGSPMKNWWPFLFY